ncbi:hypothetical protein [uncultured Aquimarina sp.]|uniref:hypothetical protein n=1 Tax=uncultured Aquimarina sp. TaxID=575652 RepID=UPI002637ED14|nr:hypothetical protein [uncultured Aquimarina sp.]
MREFRIRGIIFGSLKPKTITIHVGYDYGMNDGGGLKEVTINIVPENCRIPNTYVWVTLDDGLIIKVEKMSIKETQENLKMQ